MCISYKLNIILPSSFYIQILQDYSYDIGFLLLIRSFFMQRTGIRTVHDNRRGKQIFFKNSNVCQILRYTQNQIEGVSVLKWQDLTVYLIVVIWCLEQTKMIFAWIQITPLFTIYISIPKTCEHFVRDTISKVKG